MSEFRRKILMQSRNVLASKWYVINPSISNTAGRNTKAYYFAIYLNGNDFYYESDYPFYIVDNGSSYYITYSYGHTIRNGTNYTSGTSYGTKNGLIYYIEAYTRTPIIQSNVDIYIWK